MSVASFLHRVRSGIRGSSEMVRFGEFGSERGRCLFRPVEVGFGSEVEGKT